MRLARRLLPTLAAAIAIVLTLSLGNWQMRRAAEKADAHAQQQAALATPPAWLESAPLSSAQAGALIGRRVLVRGALLPERSIYVDNRTHEGIAGFHLVTPLRIEAAGNGGEPADGKAAANDENALHVLVLRGWLPRDPYERTRLPVPPAPDGTVELLGWAESELPQTLELKQLAPAGPDQRIWQNLTRERFERWSGLEVQPVVVRQTEATRLVESASVRDGEGRAGTWREVDEGLVREWSQPGAGIAKHHGYAFQWYALAAATAALWVWFVIVVPARARRVGAVDRN